VIAEKVCNTALFFG